MSTQEAIANGFSADDLEPTDLSMNTEVPDTRSRQQKAADTRRAQRSSVNPGDVIDVGSTQGTRQSAQQKGAETRKANRASAEEKAKARREEAAIKIRTILDKKVDPVLATVGRMALQVPEQIAWMGVDQDPETGDVLLDATGNPRYHYYNGAQMLILQPLEKELICMMAPSIMEYEVSEKAKEFAKKATPFVVGGGMLLLVANYGIRLAQVKKQMTPLRAAANRTQVIDNEQAQAGESQ